MRAKSGIAYLDSVLGGGFDRGSLILLKESTGTPVKEVCSVFIENGLRAGEHCYVFASSQSPRRIVDNIPDVQRHINSGRLRLIDGYTNAWGWKEFKSEEKYSTDIKSFRRFHSTLRNVAKGIPREAAVRGVVDSLTFLESVNDDSDPNQREQWTIEFFHHQSVMHKKSGLCSIYTLASELCAFYKETLPICERLADYVLSLSRVNINNNHKTLLTVEKTPDGKLPDCDYFVGTKPLTLKRR